MSSCTVESSWNVMAHAQKPDFVFWGNGRVHLNRQGSQCSRLLATEVCASAVVMLDTPCCEVAWRVLAIHSIRQFPLHFPSRASPCAITFQLDSTVCFSTEHDLPPTGLLLPLQNHTLMNQYHTCTHTLHRICLPKDQPSGSKHVHVDDTVKN